MQQIEVVGIGLDGKSGLTVNTAKIINQATVLSGAKRHLDYFFEHPASKIPLKDLQQDIDLLIAKAIANEKVVILASGDPLFFGLGRLLLTKIPPEKLNFYPHFSSVQLAFSKLKIPWHDAIFVSVHGRDCDNLIQCWKQGKNKIAILTDRDNNPSAIANLYLALQLPIRYSFHVCENVTLENGSVSSFSPDEIEQLAQLPIEHFASLNVLILCREDTCQSQLDLTKLPLLGIPDSTFLSFRDRPNLITKKEVRSLIISELALQAKQIIWDIGAGTGSVAIEIARLVPNSTIFAIEKTAIGISLIEQNCQRFAVKNIQPIAGKAPDALRELPTPNRIFIGGSGGNLFSILSTCQIKIAPQGIIILALATLENLTEAIQWVQQNNWHYSLLQVQISRSTPIANLTRLFPLNPVTILKISPKS